MKPMKDLKCINEGYDVRVWPVARDFLRIEEGKLFLHYSKKDHVVLVTKYRAKRKTMNAQGYEDWSVRWINDFYDDHADATMALPAELLPGLKARAAKSAEQADKTRQSKDFSNAVTKNHSFGDELKLRRFLLDKSSGIYPEKWRMLVRRIGPEEYILGADLSGTGTQSTMVTRMLPAILHSKATFWPSVEDQQKREWKYAAEPVCLWVLRNLRSAQLKRPAAMKKNRPGWDCIHLEALEIFSKVLDRWDNIPASVTEEVEILCDLYGDVKKMKEYNSGLRMQFKLTGEVS